MAETVIEELERKVEQIEIELAKAKTDLWEALLEKAKKVYGIDYGTIVMSRNEEYKVVSIDVRWDKPWLKGYGKKKDSTWGKALRSLYDDWEIKK